MVLACSGWTLTNETTGVAQKGTGSTATFTVRTNETVSLFWSVATNAVFVKVAVDDVLGFGNNAVPPRTITSPVGPAATARRRSASWRASPRRVCSS